MTNILNFRYLQCFGAILSICLLGGCHTPESARMAGDTADILFGRGAGRKMGAENLFKSKQLKYHEAVCAGNYTGVVQNFDPKFINVPFKGYPMIYYAALVGNPNVTRFLIQNGESVKVRHDGKSPAWLAAAAGNIETANILIAAGGGTKADISSGQARYAAMRNQRRQQLATMERVAGAFINMMAAGSGGGSDSSYDDMRRQEQAIDREHFRQSASQGGDSGGYSF